MPQRSSKAIYGSGVQPTALRQYLPWKLLTLLIGLFIVVTIFDARRLPKSAEITSVSIAATLIETGTFTDGSTPAPGRKIAPGYNYPPGYPALVAFIGGFTPNATAELRCYVTKRLLCSKTRTVNSVIYVQVFISAIALVLAFLLALELSRSREIASLTLILLFITTRIGEFILLLTPNAIITALTISACYFILMAFKRDNVILSFLAGAAFSLEALFHPPVAMSTFLIAPFLYFATQKSTGRGATHTAALIAGAALVLTPWMARNYSLFGDFAISDERSAYLLAVRVAYNYMSWTEWFAAYLAWLPGLGDALAGTFFSDETINRLAYSYEGGIIVKGGGEILRESLAGSNPHLAFWQIVQNHIIGQPWRYLSTTPPVFLHGFWGSGSILGIIGVFALIRLFRRLRATGALAGFSLIFWSLIAVLLLQSLLSANYHYLNDQMLFIHAYAIAHVTGGLELPRIFRRE